MNWESLAIQIPIVLIFSYVFIKLINLFMSSMHKRDEAYLAAINSITSQMTKMNESNIEHASACQLHDETTNAKLEDIKKKMGSRSRRLSAN